MNQDIRIIVLAAAAISIGLIVLAANPNYRISKNWESNKDYYPGIGDFQDSTPSFVSPSSLDTLSADPDQEVLDDDIIQNPKDLTLIYTDSGIEF